MQKDATAASVISDAATALGLDPGRMYVLAEVKECGGEEWVLEAGDLPAQRFLLWPRKAQEQHPQSLGFYFLLQVELIAHCLLCCQTGCRVKSPSSVTIACYFVLFQEAVSGEKIVNLNVYFFLYPFLFRRGIMTALSIMSTSHL